MAGGTVSPRKLAEWESDVERQIREAQERGDFDDLPGRGKPLPVEAWHGEWALAFHVLRQAGGTLPWIALRHEIEERRACLRQLLEDAERLDRRWRPGPAWAAERERARARYLKEAAELDKQLLDYGLLVPSSRLEQGRLPPHIAAQQFDAVCGP